MNWEEYQANCLKTLKYKSYKEMIACCALEISDEVTEFVEHYVNESEELLILKELGDVTYPLAVLSHYFGIELQDVSQPYFITPSIADYFEDNGIYIAGKIAGVIKKVIRDSDYILDDTKDRRNKLAFYMNSLYTSIRNHCAKRGINFSDILSLNIEKLSDRNKRGVIQGDGDER